MATLTPSGDEHDHPGFVSMHHITRRGDAKVENNGSLVRKKVTDRRPFLLFLLIRLLCVISYFITVSILIVPASSDSEEAADTSVVFFNIALLFLVGMCLSSLCMCGCCGMQLFNNTFKSCVKDENYIQMNSLFATVFGSLTFFLLFPFLFDENSAGLFLILILSSAIMFLYSCSCLTCCSTYENMEDREADKHRAGRRTLIRKGLASLPLVAFFVGGIFLINVKSYIFENLTGQEFFFSAEGYYWSLDTSERGIAAMGDAPDSSSDGSGNQNGDDGNFNLTSVAQLLQDYAVVNLVKSTYGSISSEDIVQFHCDAEELQDVVFRNDIDSICNPFVDDDIKGCPAGLFYNSTSMDHEICPAGFFCPVNFKCFIACIEGAACLPTVLNVTSNKCERHEGMGGNINPVPIENDELVCPGESSSSLCPAGFYCTLPNSAPIICPKNYFCPTGSYKPFDCSSIATQCNKTGLSHPEYYFTGPVAQVTAILVLLVSLSYKFYDYYKKKIDSKSKEDKESTTHTASPSEVSALMSKADAEDEEEGKIKVNLRMDIKFKNLGLVLHGGEQKKVLNGVTGTLRSGRITAIMGQSGSGKTTFLNVIAGKASYGTTTGTIEINGAKDSILNYSNIVGFVPQDDVMLTQLTIMETLMFYARIRCPSTHTNAQCKKVVDEVIETLGLSHVKHSQIGDETKRGVSGGQRKRVNVAMEMVASPSVLFLDEATSGLDSSTSYELLVALGELAKKKGCNIIVILHQPSYQLFKLFDDVLLLGRGGSTVYLGEGKDCLDYFEGLGFACPDRINPADFFMDVIAGKYTSSKLTDFIPSHLFGLWNLHTEEKAKTEGRFHTAPQISALALRSKNPVGFWMSLYLFSFRAILQYRKDKMVLLGDIGLQLICGLVVGALYSTFAFRQITTMNFMLSLILGLTVSLASLRPFGLEREVFWREGAPGSGMNLNTFAYFWAKVIVELPRLFILTLAVLVTFYPQASPRSTFWSFFWLCFCGAYMASGIPLLFSVSMNPKSAQLATVVFILIVNMMSGTNPRLDAIQEMGRGPSMVSGLSYARYLCESLFTNETELYSDAWKMPPTFYKSSSTSVVARLLAFSYTENVNVWNVLLMLWFGTMMRMAAYAAIIIVDRDKRSLPGFVEVGVMNVITPLKELVKNITDALRGRSNVLKSVLKSFEEEEEKEFILIGEERGREEGVIETNSPGNAGERE